MDLRPRSVIARFRGKALRYIAVSLLGTALTQVLLVVMVHGLGWDGPIANVVAVTLTTIPSFLLSKHWIWADGDPASVHRQVLPFWALSLAGLALSTLFVWVAQSLWDADWVVNLANLAGFGVLWVAKFLILDTYLFARPMEAA